VLNERGFATLLFDLLTASEDRDPSRRFDIPLLARRLETALDWTRDQAQLCDLPIGLFGASTGAAAALIVAATRPGETTAVVSRGGRPDLAGEPVLARVRCPVLLIVGSADHQVLELNRGADAAMREWSELVLVPRATHLFEEPGTLAQAATFAADWFERWLARGHRHRQRPDAGTRPPERLR
jgi:putative phosphoribosyl transferase